eukprot:CFRG5375T1
MGLEMAEGEVLPTAAKGVFDLEDTQTRIDELIVQIMEDYDRLQEYYGELGRLMKEGHMNIAQARHYKGPNTINTLQYPQVITPLVRAQRTDFEWKLMETGDTSRKEAEKCSTLTRRKKPASGSDSESDHEDKMPAKADIKTGRTEPLRWFGVLVPVPLRTAKKQFRNAVNVSLDMVGIKSRIDSNLTLIEELRLSIKSGHI